MRNRIHGKTGLYVFLQLLPVIGFLWLGIFLRWDNIGESIPYFIDEIHHMRRSRIVWTFEDPQTSLTPSKFGTYYWLGLFQLPEYPDLLLVRAPVAMLSMLGAAGAFALTKRLFDRRAALLAVAMASVWPFMLFYERLALTDPPTASIAVIMTWWSLVLVQNPTMMRANILALLVAVMFAFKFLSIPLVIVPFAAAAFFGKQPLRFGRPLRPQIQDIWQIYKPYIWRVTLIVGTIWTLILGIYVFRLIVTPEDVNPIVNEELYTGGIAGDTGSFGNNLELVYEIFYYMWSPLLMGLALFGLVTMWFSKNWRYGAFAVVAILPVWIFITLVAGKLATRYFTVVGYLCIVFISGGTIVFFHEMRNRGQSLIGAIPAILLIGWMIVFGLPFAVTAGDDAVDLEIPFRDKGEYFRRYTGYALPDAFDYIEARGSITPAYEHPLIIAPIRVCSFSSYHMTATQREELNVICQGYLPGESGDERFQRRYEWLQATLTEYGTAYLMIEQYENSDGPINIDVSQLDASITWLTTFERPHDGIPVEVYEFNVDDNNLTATIEETE